MLVAGLLAGLVATAIGLAGVTGIELVGGKNLSCLVWSSCSEDEESGGSSGRSSLSILGGYSGTGTGTTPSGNSSGEQPSAPGNGQQVPKQQPGGDPTQSGADGTPSQSGGIPQQQPGETPEESDDPAQPGSDYPGMDGEEPATPSGKASEEDRGQGPEKGQEKEDRDEPGPL